MSTTCAHSPFHDTTVTVIMPLDLYIKQQLKDRHIRDATLSNKNFRRTGCFFKCIVTFLEDLL